MLTVLLVVVVVVLIAAVVLTRKNSSHSSAGELADAKAEARRWVERLGGQVLNLVGSNEAAEQALADASERYTAAGSQMDQADTLTQCRLATQTALEGLYYVRAARIAMGMDPGPELPEVAGQRTAGRISEDRAVTVEGHPYAASPTAGTNTPYYYPGGSVAGRPVPQGWYSEPWWKTALVAGAWGVGSFVVMDALFSGTHGVGDHGALGMADGGTADGGWTDGGWGGGDWGGDLGGF
jgi:hypothetical protein